MRAQHPESADLSAASGPLGVAMTLRLLHIADVHLDRAFAAVGCYGVVAQRRREGLREALRRAGRIAAEQGCQVVTIAGDLYEAERSDLETGRFLADLFAAWAPIRVALAPGNHDPLDPASLYRRTEWPPNVHLFTERTLRPLPLADGLTLWGLAHREPRWGGDPLVCPPVGADGGVHLALFHGAELGSRPQGKSVHGPFRAERIRERGFAAALCGHYHDRRFDPTTRLLYPGSLEPLGFDEEGNHGPALVEVESSGRIRVTLVDDNAWTVKTVTCEVDGLRTSAAVEDAVRASASQAVAGGDAARTVLRIDLRGEIAMDVAPNLPTLEGAATEASGAAAVTVRDRTVVAIDPATAAADPTTLGAVARTLLAAIERAENEAERAVLEDALRYGLQALSGVEIGLR